ncbi:UvrD-helicase domain-containing protein [Cohnella xylanilytica]|uniref:ATP-dependent helicase/nuclease subunit A n=1 Tax=Cohnella xylanilytica TaxID=557555 RepID=A0A841UC13_9BACL|nr:UvrD-helicase domain-containing protein [Cohnella xylanilytica]MBB6695491.1 UvrD-helicase domain-containing protein [Cohnella xylanilytica]
MTARSGLEATYLKPAGSRWTDEQWAAIAADGSNILVAAAAGSGKTAVLVERIISRVADEERPLDVDALLVATFTKAAAAEMKERIRVALEDALEKKPDSAHLRRQLALLPRASITTLHSFCMEVIEKYSTLIGLDPGFRIANETEAELLRMDTLDAVFEERYEREGESGQLARLADLFGGERSDEPLHKLVLELHEFARSHPWPEWWLSETASRFRVADAAELAKSEWADSMRRDVTQSLEGVLQLLRTGLAIAEGPGGPAPYASTLADDLGAVSSLLAAVRGESWETWSAAFAACSFGRLKPCRGDDYDPALQERVKGLRDEAKKAVTKLGEEWFVRTPEQFADELRSLAPDIAALAEVAIEFGERYEAAKREKGLLDFGDLEHYALRILRSEDSTPERSEPSAAALDYRRRFAEILLDEYQDTNEVQEAIVSLIAKPEPGNVFMVGDVKQSIYRFRLAEPGLFLAKYKAYDVWTARREEASSGGESLPKVDGSTVGGGSPGVGGSIRGGGSPDGQASNGQAPSGLRIDLARNFRSRPRVVDAVNHVFRLIMRESVGEMDYDRRAELIYGEGYPPEESVGVGAPRPGQGPGRPSSHSVEMILLQAGGAAGAGSEADASAGEEAAQSAAQASDGAEESGAGGAEEELETVQLEARCIAAEIKRLMGTDGSGGEPFAVYDGRTKLYRPLAYRDIVILLRAATSLAPAVLEELKGAGIPAYADLATGYFAATEVDVMLSLLQLIDNPDQDIPLAGVLRSPLVGLTAEELARIRLHGRKVSYWGAVRAAAASAAEEDADLAARLRGFAASLEAWRGIARREPLGELLGTLYRETGYYDFVGGLPGGAQRQANLRALVDRARQFERSAGSRGLFRFLRFLGRMKDTGADLGAARALGEQEDVVRVVSIHKSKGLEFPVVFVAGLGRSFNKQDLNGLFLKHKKLGFGPKLVDPETRVAYPTLPQLAIRRRLKAEMLAEEMRVLYVALTRPKEKLILVGTTKNAEKELAKWQELAEASRDGLPDYAVSAANRYLDWLGPAATLACRGWELPASGGSAASGSPSPSLEVASASDFAARSMPSWMTPGALWTCRVVPGSAYTKSASEDDAAAGIEGEEPLWNLALALKPVPVPETEAGKRAYEALSWIDPHAAAARLAAKTSITALKRQLAEAGRETASAGLSQIGETGGGAVIEEPWDEDSRFDAGGKEELPDTAALTYRLRRPKFLSAKKLTPAERGTAVHLVMQHLPLVPGTDADAVEELLDRLVERRILTTEQRRAVQADSIAAFCRTPLFERMCRASKTWREVPFSYGLPARSVYPGLDAGAADEPVLIQGVIDCLFPEDDGLVLVDYKTDRVLGDAWEAAAEKHRFQIERYAEAIGGILGRKVKEGYVYFVDGGRSVRLL